MKKIIVAVAFIATSLLAGCAEDSGAAVVRWTVNGENHSRIAVAPQSGSSLNRQGMVMSTGPR